MTLPATQPRLKTYLIFFVIFALILFLTHAPHLGLPYFWDELGQFVPAALDLLHDGRWIPHSTTPNVHPPGVMAYLAGVWLVAGYSIEATRVAMLLAASAGVLAVFLLAIVLLRGTEGSPAFLPSALLLVAPLFYTQSMMAQLDMPAMTLTVLALLWFLEERLLPAAVVSTALVLVKETGVVVPLVFAAWLAGEQRWRQALLFAAPLVALAVWLAVLARATGHLFGAVEFTDYNLFYPLHPGRLGVALARRASWLFIENFHWLGTIGIGMALARGRVFAGRAWRVTVVVGAAHVLAVTLLGGATLERYLLPVVPLFYIAVAAAWNERSRRARRLALAALGLGLTASNFWSPFWSSPYENNLAMIPFVRLHQAAAEHLARRHAGATVLTAWPLTDALRRPEFGYVKQGFRVRGVQDFGPASFAEVRAGDFDVLVLYSREADPKFNLLRLPLAASIRRKLYGWEPAISSRETATRFGLVRTARWELCGQWIEIHTRQAAGPVLEL